MCVLRQLHPSCIPQPVLPPAPQPRLPRPVLQESPCGCSQAAGCPPVAARAAFPGLWQGVSLGAGAAGAAGAVMLVQAGSSESR